MNSTKSRADAHGQHQGTHHCNREDVVLLLLVVNVRDAQRVAVLGSRSVKVSRKKSG